MLGDLGTILKGKQCFFLSGKLMLTLSSYKKLIPVIQKVHFGKVSGEIKHTFLFSHATHRSAGVSFLFNRFTGDILEHFNSEDGRWIIVVVKLDNSFLDL